MSQKASERESVRSGPRRGQLEARGRAGAHQGARRPDGLLDQPARDSDERQERARHQGRGDAEGREPGQPPHQTVSARRANAGRRTWASSMNRCACSLATCCSPPPSSRTLRPSRVRSASDPRRPRGREVEGFNDSKNPANKFVTMYYGCGQLLSKQMHYDWGLRAMSGVLRIAGWHEASGPRKVRAADSDACHARHEPAQVGAGRFR